MRFKLINVAFIGAILLGAASCVKVNEELGGNFIPTDQQWNVFPCEAEPLEGITMERSDSLSGYSTTRFTFGSVKDDNFTSSNSTSFTLVPLSDSLDFGEETQVLQFHLTAIRDTVSVLYDRQQKMLQNFYVRPLLKPLDSTVLYTGTFNDEQILKEYVDLNRIISEGIPVYDGGDSLSFNFSKEYAMEVIEGIGRWQAIEDERRDSLKYYLEEVPGIYIHTKEQTDNGGRINMFELPISTADGYLDGNYAELKIRAKYDGRLTDTLFVFYFGPTELIDEDATSYPSQLCLNTCRNTAGDNFKENWEAGSRESLYVEGGSGFKPVVRAREVKDIVERLIQQEAPEVDVNSVVINKATIILPYNVGTDYEKLDKYPMILSPTVKVPINDGDYVSYAGLTDSSIESENQGDINRSLGIYSPDVSHHVQEIFKLKRGEGKNIDAQETEAEFEKRLSKYDIWFLILHEEITESSSSNNNYNDYYNNLLYNSYYNNMMYDPYGYGYGYGGYGGYGYGGYGYGGYGGYGYNNYYNYLMMAQYASASNSSTTTSSSVELDKDRFYSAVLNGPGASDSPKLKITFSAPKKAEE